MNSILMPILAVFFVSIIFLIFKYKRDLVSLRTSFIKLSKSFEELDEQAKLIVKTDLELNKTQEELDKRLSGLDALQKLSRAINTTLDENEIFNRLSYNLLNEIGFEKYLFVLLSENFSLRVKRFFGFSKEVTDNLQIFFLEHSNITDELQKGTTLCSLTLNQEEREHLSRILNTEDFIIAPILVQNTLLGLTIAGNHSVSFSLTEGDAEIISILADQLGQAIENAHLFEEVYVSRQNLELTVQDRTKQLTEVLERVQYINKTKSEFISAVSHELRTPLTSIKGYASILMAGKIGKIPEAVKERLKKINKHSDNLVSLINNLLDISRIESGKADLKFRLQPLDPIIEAIEDLLMPQLKENKITFQKNIPDNLPPIFMDANQVERVLINLIGNAIKFTPIDGVISVSAFSKGKYVTLSVADTGVGLKPEDCEKLFDEFYRVENEINQNVKGSGLGLSLVKKIIEAHEGIISVKSKVGEGSTFTFTLPTWNIQKT